MMPHVLTIATRESPMALWQAKFVKESLLKLHPSLHVVIAGITTQGDINTSQPLYAIGGKDLFVKELQHALLNNQADIAVHCVKDMSVHPVPGIIIGGYLKRDDPRDVLLSTNGKTLDTLPANSTIGTSSPRRTSLILMKRPDLRIKPIRGNVNTRLNKLLAGEYDAIVLSLAGLERLNLKEHITDILPPSEFIPAIGQGALAIECRSCDEVTKKIISPINHHPTELCITAERAVNQRLLGDCHSPIGAHCELINNTLTLRAMVSTLCGSHSIIHSASTDSKKPHALGEHVANHLLSQGASDILHNIAPPTGDTNL